MAPAKIVDHRDRLCVFISDPDHNLIRFRADRRRSKKPIDGDVENALLIG
jgi:hypothetical protein